MKRLMLVGLMSGMLIGQVYGSDEASSKHKTKLFAGMRYGAGIAGMGAVGLGLVASGNRLSAMGAGAAFVGTTVALYHGLSACSNWLSARKCGARSETEGSRELAACFSKETHWDLGVTTGAGIAASAGVAVALLSRWLS